MMIKLTIAERNQLRLLLLNYFDKNEIKSFYFELTLTVDHLEASSREKLVADLIQHLENQARLLEFIELAIELRPTLKHALTASAYPSLARLYQAHEAEMPAPTLAKSNSQLLVSYSQRDQRWQARLAQHLHRVIAPQAILYQDDQTDFIAQYDTLNAALQHVKLAVLLVSTHFLSSDVIQTEQLPKLFALQASGQLQLYPIILKPCTWQLLDWLQQQRIHPAPNRELSSGSPSQVETDLAQMAQEIAQQLVVTAV
jgi:hypothetical protein